MAKTAAMAGVNQRRFRRQAVADPGGPVRPCGSAPWQPGVQRCVRLWSGSNPYRPRSRQPRPARADGLRALRGGSPPTGARQGAGLSPSEARWSRQVLRNPLQDRRCGLRGGGWPGVGRCFRRATAGVTPPAAGLLAPDFLAGPPHRCRARCPCSVRTSRDRPLSAASELPGRRRRRPC